jgi:Uma2 family endonuclease
MITRYDATTTYLPTAEELPYSDDTPVDNEFQRLIPFLLQSILAFAWQDRTDWFFGMDMGIYYHPQKSAVAPDAFLSLGVDYYKGGDDKGRSSYVLWEENYVVPTLAIETVSQTYGSEYDKKRDIYAQMGVLYYAVFSIKPKSRRGHQILEIYRLVEGEYQLLSGDRVWMPEIGLALGKERSILDTLRSKDAEILGSTKPLNLDSLRSLSQRWGSPQATSGMPYPSCLAASSFLL